MREIQLTQGKVALVDDDMFEYLSQWKWYAAKHKRGDYYAGRTKNFKNPNGQRTTKTILMHRVIAGTNDSITHIDHINHNTLDNQISNLRNCTLAENNKNVSSHKGSTSRFLGVSWHKQNKKWVANIKQGGKVRYLGSFSCENKCAIAYTEAALKDPGQFANLNIIPESNSLTPKTNVI